jgi:YggT family protein
VNPAITQLLVIFLYALIVAVIVRSLLTWFPIRRDNEFVRLLDRVTEPLVDPIRRILPRTGSFDFSPMIVTVLLYVMVIAVQRVEA